MPATMTYNAAADFPSAQTAGDDITYYGIWSARNGGTFYGSQSVSNDPDALAVGEHWQVAAGQVVLTFSDGDMQATWAKFLADLAAGVTLWLSGHTDDPGDNGANEATYTGYSRVELVPANQVTAQT